MDNPCDKKKPTVNCGYKIYYLHCGLLVSDISPTVIQLLTNTHVHNNVEEICNAFIFKGLP